MNETNDKTNQPDNAPIDVTQINREEFVYNHVEVQVEERKTFGDYFKNLKFIQGSEIRNLFLFGDNIYEKLMGFFMGGFVFAGLSPILLIIGSMGTGGDGMLGMGCGLLLFAYFITAFLGIGYGAGYFLPLIWLSVFGKLFHPVAFIEAVIALVMFVSLYCAFRAKKKYEDAHDTPFVKVMSEREAQNMAELESEENKKHF